MILYQWGELQLDTPVIRLFGPDYALADARKAYITPRHLLLHEAGFPPDPTPVSYCAPSFMCPETRITPSHRRLSFSCQNKSFENRVRAQPLDTMPGEKFVYSDISMITMMDVVGHLAREGGHVSRDDLLRDCVEHKERGSSGGGSGNESHSAAVVAPIAQCYYEAFARKHIFAKLAPHGPFMGFRLPESLWPTAAPTWNDTRSGFPGECVQPYRERVLQGEVCDGNAYALGGVAGHAGLFANLHQVYALVHDLLFGSKQPSGGLLGISDATVQLFTKVHNASRSSRALGWDTASPPHNLPLCGNLSAATFTHTGYTGTQVCADPTTRGGLITVLLTNRVYPKADAASEERIHDARIRFNNAVLAAANSD